MELNTNENNIEESELNENIFKSKITYELNNNIYILQMFILQNKKKLKLNLEVTNKNKAKKYYSNSFSINDLISQNKFFNKFKDYSEAFNYLLNNYTKVEKTKFLSNNKEIKILLLFTINENSNQNNIIQQGLEFILHYSNINRTKLKTHLASTIHNLKTTLEKFNTSINNEKNKMKNEIENLIDTKIKEIKIYKNNNELKNNNNEENAINMKLDKLYSKISNYNNQINELKISNEENNQKYNISKNNELKINEIIKKINNIEERMKLNDEKNQKLETNIRNNLSELNNKINLNLKKANNNEVTPTSVDKQDIILKKEDNKILEKIIQEKLNEEINNRMKIYEEKIQILNKKIIDLEIKNQNQNKLVKDTIMKNEQSSFITDNSYIDFKIHELEEKFNKNNNEKDNNKKKDLNIIEYAYTKDNKNNNQAIENKIEDLKKEIFSMIKKINERGIDDYKDLNTKILNMKVDLMKNIDKKISFDNIIEKENKSSSQDINLNQSNRINHNSSKKDLKNKNYDINSSITMNNSYVNINTLKNNDEENPKVQNINSSFNNYTSNNNSYISKKKFELNIDSNIFKKEDLTEDFFLFSKIKEIYPYNRYLRLILIYRGSRDGDTSKIFHSKCDLIGPNITLIKTKKGYIFGGFTIKSWKHLFKDIKNDNLEFGSEYKDEKSFGFSFNYKKIYNNEKPHENVIYCNNKYGAVFIKFFKIFDEYYKNGGICEKLEDNIFSGQEREYEINGGEEKFDIEEIEVFQIAFR